MIEFKCCKHAKASRYDRVSLIHDNGLIAIKAFDGLYGKAELAMVTPAMARKIAAALMAMADEVEQAGVI